MTVVNELFSLEGRVALITGASRGLGLAMAEALAKAGATVILNGRNADTLRVAADELRNRNLKAETLAFDVTDQHAANAAIQSIGTNHHRLDVLIANAGIIHRAQIAESTPEAWDEVVATNLKACFFLAQQAAASMRTQRHGRIIFITIPRRHIGKEYGSRLRSLEKRTRRLGSLSRCRTGGVRNYLQLHRARLVRD